MILGQSDKNTLFPEVPLDGDALGAAIYRAITVAQGPSGANRNLEVREYSQILPVYEDYSYLSFAPVVEIQSVFGKRNRAYDSWNRLIARSEWQELTTDDYIFEPELNRISLVVGEFYSNLKVTYLSGYVFDETTGPIDDEALQIKHKIAAILEYQQSGPGLGIKDLREGDMRFQEANPGKVPDELLMPLYCYRPRR